MYDCNEGVCREILTDDLIIDCILGKFVLHIDLLHTAIFDYMMVLFNHIQTIVYPRVTVYLLGVA